MSRTHDEKERNTAPRLAEAVRAITGPLLADTALQDGFVQLLVAAGRLPQCANATIPDAKVRAMRAQSAALLEELLELALLQAAGENDEHLAEIRRFLLDPQYSYSLGELATLWRLSHDDAADICHDEITQWEQASAPREPPPFRLPWARAVGATMRFALLRPFDVERALGDHFPEVRGERWRTVAVVIRLPRFLAEAFELYPTTVPRLALAHRVEQLLLELFSTEPLTGNGMSEGIAP